MTTNQRVRTGIMKKKGKSKETKKRMRKKKTDIYNMSMTQNKRKKKSTDEDDNESLSSVQESLCDTKQSIKKTTSSNEEDGYQTPGKT